MAAELPHGVPLGLGLVIAMTQKGVESALGRLATDESVRRRFEAAPVQTLQELVEMGLELSPVERAALAALDPSAIRRFAQALDPRLQKARLTPEEVRA